MSELDEVREVLQSWVDKQGHDRCWYYPDLFNKLCKILKVKPTKKPSLPSLEEFKKGCCKYQSEEYEK